MQVESYNGVDIGMLQGVGRREKEISWSTRQLVQLAQLWLAPTPPITNLISTWFSATPFMMTSTWCTSHRIYRLHALLLTSLKRAVLRIQSFQGLASQKTRSCAASTAVPYWDRAGLSPYTDFSGPIYTMHPNSRVPRIGLCRLGKRVAEGDGSFQTHQGDTASAV